MFFQIKKLILWPKNTEYDPQIIEFEVGKVNIITGASRTGKSAIIPIIDYCLGSEKCSIPVKTIRNACSWFGIVIQLNDSQILLAREEPGIKKSTDKMYILEDKEICVPKSIEKNENRDNVKKRLDEIARLTFLEVENSFVGFSKSRPSFRDLMAFCFQPQNIVANANTLFYKADTTEHRQKLINIFPYLLGAVTQKDLANKNELAMLTNKLKTLDKALSNLKRVGDKWREEINSWLLLSRELGLIELDGDLNVLTFEEQLHLLDEITNKNATDSKLVNDSINLSTEEIILLRQREEDLSNELVKAKRRYTEMKQLMGTVDNYREALNIQLERLHISKWLKNISDKSTDKPLFGNSNNHPENIIGKFYEKLIQIEDNIDTVEKLPVSFEREFETVCNEIEETAENLNIVRKKLKLLNDKLTDESKSKFSLESVSRFLGRLEYAKETFTQSSTDSKLIKDIEDINIRMEIINQETDSVKSNIRLKLALSTINTFAMELLQFLDSERPNDSMELDIENLTIKVQGKDGRKDYLWEIGSGSNWLAYHISITLALQLKFLKSNYSPIPSFIVYDQPSQVYFPKKLANNDDSELDPKLVKDEDKLAVQKIFITMSQAIKKSKNRLQVIVLEHADSSIYGGLENIHEVCEWRGEKGKLIPEEWIKEDLE
ncbi:DUF3732 domain-containing protein [Lysinibacillus sp. NPDC097162]|uniref:DUF3732 domain-containing protein n=1 Tax=Lysinibacillus sp. NPDC097162 TaxID=3364140 RepID=UPI0037F28760